MLTIYNISLLLNKTNKIMSAIKELLIEMQEMYSTVDLTEMLYPTSMEDEPVNKEAVLKQYQLNQSKVTKEDYEQNF